MRTVEYLDALKARHSIETEAALERLLHVSKATRKNYRHGRTAFDDATALRVAGLLEVDPARVLADMAAERATSPEVRAIWQRVASSMCVMSTALRRLLAVDPAPLMP